MRSRREYRMYGLVPYNLSPIQQGIQFGHAVVEYSVKYGKDSDYKKWSQEDKTFIILNGGTTNYRRFDGKYIGTLNQYEQELSSRGIKMSEFIEPDLGDQLTAVVFLVDDRVFDREKWPDYEGLKYIDVIDGNPESTGFREWKMKFDDNEKIADKIVWLREFLPKFKLA